jgi:hypothetical protein
MNRQAVIAAVRCAFRSANASVPAAVCVACLSCAHGDREWPEGSEHDRTELTILEAALALRLLDLVRIGLIPLGTVETTFDLHGLAARAEGL